jgi:hypothetical protein
MGARIIKYLWRLAHPCEDNLGCHFRMELQAIDMLAKSKGLVGKYVPSSYQLRVLRNLKAFRVPLVERLRAIETAWGGNRGPNQRIADFSQAVGVKFDPRPKRASQQLAAKANSQKRPLQRNPSRYPVDLAADIGSIRTVVSALCSAIDNRHLMAAIDPRQAIAIRRTAPFEFITESQQTA